MKFFALAAAIASAALPAIAAPEPPNQPVFRSGPWFVVRSVRDGGKVVGCTGFYRANRHVQLGRDSLVIQTIEDVRDVAFGFDDHAPGARRPLTNAEKELKAVAFTGEDFSRLAHSKRVRIDVGTPQGTMRHELDLNGLAAALENIEKGCPVPQDAKPVRKRPRS